MNSHWALEHFPEALCHTPGHRLPVAQVPFSFAPLLPHLLLRPPLPMGSPWVLAGEWRLGPTTRPPTCVRKRLGPICPCRLCWCQNSLHPHHRPQHYLGVECRRGCRRNGGRGREEQDPGWRWGMKTSPCAQRKRLAAGGCPALADSLGRQGQGCGQEATPASHLLSALPIATSPSISGQLEGGDFKCHLPPPPSLLPQEHRCPHPQRPRRGRTMWPGHLAGVGGQGEA